MVSLTSHSILFGWYRRIRQIPSECSFGVTIDQRNRLLNSIRIVPLDEADTPRTSIWCIHWPAREAIKYYVDGTVGLGGYHTNIYSVYPLVSLTGYTILCG